MSNQRHTPKSKTNSAQQPGKPKRVRVVMLLSGAILVWVSVSLYNQIDSLTTKQEEYKAIQQELKILQEETTELETKANRLHDPEYIEEKARVDLNMLREGEKIITEFP